MNNDLDINSNEDWEYRKTELAEKSSSEASEMLSDDLYWQYSLRHINQPDEVKLTFWEAFKGDDLFLSRSRAIKGVVGHNRREASNIIKQILDCEKYPESDFSRSLLAAHIIHLADERKHEVFSHLGEIVKEGALQSFTGVSGDVWRCFCDFYIENWKLPTKGELRKLTDLDYSEFSKTLKQLGLQGLPK
jgi:hypothetical protein